VLVRYSGADDSNWFTAGQSGRAKAPDFVVIAPLTPARALI
jgi:hypothetical protein